jgi:hypothetical protein
VQFQLLRGQGDNEAEGQRSAVLTGTKILTYVRPLLRRDIVLFKLFKLSMDADSLDRASQGLVRVLKPEATPVAGR